MRPEELPDPGFRYSVDYDVARWLQVPRPGSGVDVRHWSRDLAKAWGEDTGRARDKRWMKNFQQQLEVFAGARYRDEPEAVYAHVRTPEGAAADLHVVTLRLLPPDDPADAIARFFVDDAGPTAVEPPTDEEVVLENGCTARVVTTHEREPDGSILSMVQIVWQPDDRVVAVLTAGSYDIGRLLVGRDDYIALAATLQIHPLDQPDVR